MTRKFIAELHIFNENKRYEVRRNTQAVSTLFSMKPTENGYWVTELPDVRRQFWFRQKITYLLTIIDPTTIEIRINFAQNKICEMRPPRQDAHPTKGPQYCLDSNLRRMDRFQSKGDAGRSLLPYLCIQRQHRWPSLIRINGQAPRNAIRAAIAYPPDNGPRLMQSAKEAAFKTASSGRSLSMQCS